MFNQQHIQRVLEFINVLKTDPPKSYRYLADFMEVAYRRIYRGFNIARISRMEVVESPMAYTQRHAYFEPDMFGFQGITLDKNL